MTNQLKHATYLLVATLMKHDFIPRVCFSLTYLLDLRGGSAGAILERNAAPQSFNRSVGRHAFHLHFVNFFNLITRGSYEVGELAVVGEQQQSFGVEVETPDRIKTAQRSRQ